MARTPYRASDYWFFIIMGAICVMFLFFGYQSFQADDDPAKEDTAPVFVRTWCVDVGLRGYEHLDHHAKHHIDIVNVDNCFDKETP